MQIESLVPEKTRAELRSRGHDLRVVDPDNDGDGVMDAVDNCANTPTPTRRTATATCADPAIAQAWH